jgi:hypothetical protein
MMMMMMMMMMYECDDVTMITNLAEWVAHYATLS